MSFNCRAGQLEFDVFPARLAEGCHSWEGNLEEIGASTHMAQNVRTRDIFVARPYQAEIASVDRLNRSLEDIALTLAEQDATRAESDRIAVSFNYCLG